MTKFVVKEWLCTVLMAKAYNANETHFLNLLDLWHYTLTTIIYYNY